MVLLICNINETSKIWQNLSYRKSSFFSTLTEQETDDLSELILKLKYSNRKSTKPRSLLPLQEGMGEMSHKKQNLILSGSVKIINVHYVALKLDLATAG